jgi:asparagine synthase (glutamine-hydrolysing)
MHKPIERVVDLTDPRKNLIFNMSVDEARAIVATGDSVRVRGIDGQFALVATRGQNVLLARSIGRPLRYFIAKRAEGPCLVAADRIDAIHRFLCEAGLADQFHPSYTRMAPAHYVTEIALVGCPDPNPTYARFFAPRRNSLPAQVAEIGRQYIGAVSREIGKWLEARAASGPIAVCFSGGIDSGSVFLLTYHAMLRLGMNPARLKAFTLSVDGGGEDLTQARRFLASLDLSLFLEPIEATAADVDWREAVKVVEDYKPLDIQSAAMALALCRGIRLRYPDWRLLIDGDGGDENLKDYPIEENPELTIRSVLNNLMLYQEGWGVDSIKHSLTYSGGLSRGYVRTYAPADVTGFDGFSPYTSPSVIEIAEGIPFIELTDWRHDRLYELKGRIVAAGVKAITGFEMPIFEKRRFQHGAAERRDAAALFPAAESEYRRAFQEAYERAANA